MLRTHPGPHNATSALGEPASSAGARGSRMVMDPCKRRSQQLRGLSASGGSPKVALSTAGGLTASRAALLVSVVLHGAAVAAIVAGLGGLGALQQQAPNAQRSSQPLRADPAHLVIEQTVALAQPQETEPPTPRDSSSEQDMQPLLPPEVRDPLALEEARDFSDTAFVEDERPTPPLTLYGPADRPFTGKVPSPGQLQNPKAKPTYSTAVPRPADSPSKPSTKAHQPSAPTAAPIKPRTPTSASAATAPVVIQKPRAKPGHNPQPVRPRSAQRRGLRGRVILRVTVSTQGQPLAIAVVRSSGHRSLDQAAQTAVKRWEFYPGLRNSQPQAADLHLEFNFK